MCMCIYIYVYMYICLYIHMCHSTPSTIPPSFRDLIAELILIPHSACAYYVPLCKVPPKV